MVNAEVIKPLMNVESVVEKVSVGTKENVIVKEEFLIVKENAVVEFVRIFAVYVEEMVLINLQDIVIVSEAKKIVTASAEVMKLWMNVENAAVSVLIGSIKSVIAMVTN